MASRVTLAKRGNATRSQWENSLAWVMSLALSFVFKCRFYMVSMTHVRLEACFIPQRRARLHLLPEHMERSASRLCSLLTLMHLLTSLLLLPDFHHLNFSACPYARSLTSLNFTPSREKGSQNRFMETMAIWHSKHTCLNIFVME